MILFFSISTTTKALFSFLGEKFLGTIILSFIFDNYILFNHTLTILKRFVLQITDKLCN